MTRREMLMRLGGAVAAVTLSPLLDLAEIVEAPSREAPASILFRVYRAEIFFGNLHVDNPRRLKVLYGITA